MKKLILSVLGLLVLLLLFFGFMWLSDNKISNFEGEVELFVRPETSPEEVMEMIGASTRIKRPHSLARVFKEKEVGKYMKPGHYCFGRHNSSVYVARILNNGWQTPVNLVLSGTMRRLPDIARKISRQMMVDSAQVIKAFYDPALQEKLGVTTATLFSIMMPDTYQVYWTDGVEEILMRQKKAVEEFWTPQRDSLARLSGLSRHQVTVLASIVKGESNYEPEFPKIAGVYLNRLHRGMKLQADPTVAYCLDYSVNRILRKHLLIESPYNTYLHAGLPPGPICVPTRACLDAVLNPDTDGGNLFFCADPSFNGSHRFASSYTAHIRNAEAYQRALKNRLSVKKTALK